MKLINEQEMLREEYRDWVREAKADAKRDFTTINKDGYITVSLEMMMNCLDEMQDFVDGKIELSEDDVNGHVFEIQRQGNQICSYIERNMEQRKPIGLL